MSRFLSIDSKLRLLAKELNGELIKKYPKRLELPRGYEQRQIIWTHNNLNLSISIFPTIKGNSDQLNKWNFSAMAWQDSDGVRYMKTLSVEENVTLKSILSCIDEHLYNSTRKLNELSIANLNPVLNLETNKLM